MSNGSPMQTPRKRRLRLWLSVLALLLVGVPVAVWVGDFFGDRQEEQDLHARMAGSLRRVIFQSRVLNATREFLIYLPPGYDDPANEGTRYPVLYLLHGCPGQARDWVVKGNAHATLERMILKHAVEPMILVFPDIEGPRGQYDCNGAMDRPDGSWSVERYFLKDVVDRVDATYRTDADAGHRGVAGVSMGGFAAANIAVRHPDVFTVVCPMSGYFRAGDFEPIARYVLGSRHDLWRANSPADTVVDMPDKAALHVLLICGAQDQYLGLNRSFVGRLKHIGVDARLDISPGRHNYAFWSAHLRECLMFANRQFRRRP